MSGGISVSFPPPLLLQKVNSYPSPSATFSSPSPFFHSEGSKERGECARWFLGTISCSLCRVRSKNRVGGVAQNRVKQNKSVLDRSHGEKD